MKRIPKIRTEEIVGEIIKIDIIKDIILCHIAI